MLQPPSRLPGLEVSIRPTPTLKPHTQFVQDNASDDYQSDTEPESLFDTTVTEFSLSATSGHSQSHVRHRRRMTPLIARQKAAELSYEIGALVKIKERLERKREKLLTTYCT
jgi:hypothetical protein